MDSILGELRTISGGYGFIGAKNKVSRKVSKLIECDNNILTFKFLRHDETFIQFNIRHIIVTWRLFISNYKNGIKLTDKDLYRFFEKIGFIEDFNKHDVSWSQYLENILNMDDKEFLAFSTQILGIKNHHKYVLDVFNKAIDSFEKQLCTEPLDIVIKNIKAIDPAPKRLIHQLQNLYLNSKKVLEIVNAVDTTPFTKPVLHLDSDEEDILIDTSNISLLNRVFKRLEDNLSQSIEYNKVFIDAMLAIIDITSQLNKTLIVY